MVLKENTKSAKKIYLNFICVFSQVEKLLDKFGKMVTENIKNSYDQNEIVAKVWNETMAVVHDVSLCRFGAGAIVHLHFT